MSHRRIRIIESVLASTYSTGVASYTDILSQDVTIGSGDRLLIMVSGSVAVTSAGPNSQVGLFKLLVGGVQKQFVGVQNNDAVNVVWIVEAPFCMSRLVTGLAAGTHTVKVQAALSEADGSQIDIGADFAMQIMVLP
jgi:hypothetical protein